MKNIGDFFKRIGGIQAKEIALRGSIQASVKEFTGIDVPIPSISIKSGNVTIKSIPHSARSVIFINKQKIIDKINNTQSIQVVTDIR
jgi:hypothetical protein